MSKYTYVLFCQIGISMICICLHQRLCLDSIQQFFGGIGDPNATIQQPK